MTTRHGCLSALRHASALRRAPCLPIPPTYVPLRFNSTSSTVDASIGDAGPTNTKKSNELSPLSSTVRNLMRLQPHSLAAIVSPSDLATAPIPKGRTSRNPNQQSALLVSSLNTITLHPTPYISFNIKTPSQTYSNIRDYGSFTVSGLDDAETSHAFVEKHKDKELNKGREKWRRALGDTGKVRADSGGRWWLLCKYRSRFSTRVGDHVIVVGEVLEAGAEQISSGGEGEVGVEERKKSLRAGLVYLDGEYRAVGKAMPTNITPREMAIRRHGSRWRVRRIEQSVVRRIEVPKVRVRGIEQLL